MKFIKKARIGAVVVIMMTLLSAPHAQADTIVNASASNEAATGSSFFSVSAFIKNIFQKNVTEKKENLEKNKDIRNKLIEEKQVKLNIKFNRENEPEPTVEAPASSTPEERLTNELSDQISKLSDIKVRIDSRIEKLTDDNIDVSEAITFSLIADEKLNNASSSLAFLTHATSSVVDASSTEINSLEHATLLDIVKNIKEAHVALINALASLSEEVGSASPLE